MKKTIVRPDGTTETFEGTAEELAEFETKVDEGEKRQKKGRRVLTEERVAEMIKAAAGGDVQQFHYHLCSCPHHVQPLFPVWPDWPTYGRPNITFGDVVVTSTTGYLTTDMDFEKAVVSS